MSKTLISLGTLGGALLMTQLAQAHELSCEKTVNGASYVEVSSYPTTLHYVLTVNNTSTSYGSDVLTASDPLLEARGFSFSPAPPFSLDLAQSASDSFDVVLNSPTECLALAAADGTADDRIDNVFSTSWESGSAQCTASVKCIPPPPPPSGATRTMGFYKTHEQALSMCLPQLDEHMGISLDLSAALGYFWGSPAAYDTGGKRSEIDRSVFLLARQLLTAECNFFLFGTAPAPADLLDRSFEVLFGSDCALMRDMATEVDAYNNSGDSVAFPAGFDPGPSTPQDAASKADDPTSPSSDHCG